MLREENALEKIVKQLALNKDSVIVDYGCGYGRILKLLTNLGLAPIGVDINEAIIESNQKSGYKCISPKEYENLNEGVDVLILFHIIEHFSPAALMDLTTDLFAKVKSGGSIIIATPLLSNYFYDDFDHIKPYQPSGFSLVFGGRKSQVQYYGNSNLELMDLHFRRSPLCIRFHRRLFIKKGFPFPQILNSILSLFYYLTFGFVGKTDGWLALYKKR